MKIKPLFNNVVLKEQEKESTTKGGFILASSSQERPDLLTVVAVGDGVTPDGTKVSMIVSVGDKVVIPTYQANKVKVDDEEFIVVNQSAILAVVNEEEN